MSEEINIVYDPSTKNIMEIAKSLRSLLDAEVIDINQYISHLKDIIKPIDPYRQWYSVESLETFIGIASPDTKANIDTKIIQAYTGGSSKHDKIAAIKVCRGYMAMGLREAKEYVENLCEKR